MNTIEIKNIDEYLNLISKINNKAKNSFPNSTPYYRGQANNKWALMPKIARSQRSQINETKLIKKIMNMHPTEFEGLNYFNILAKLQHFGAPTRLLDFTENPFIALFFACKNDKYENEDGEIFFTIKDDLEIRNSQSFETNLMSFLSFCGIYDLIAYCIRPKKLSFTHFSEAIYLSNSYLLSSFIAIKEYLKNINKSFINEVYSRIIDYKLVLPEMLNERLIRQKGLFLLCSNKIETIIENDNMVDFFIEETLEDLKEKIINKMEMKIIIKSCGKQKLLEQLNLMGINRLFLFPDLQNSIEQIVLDINCID